MMSGMGRVFTYQNQAPNPLIPNPKYAWRKLKADDRQFHFMGSNDVATNGNDGEAMIANTRWKLHTEWRLGYHEMHGYESETHFGRYIGKMQWLFPYIGFDYRYRKMGIDEEEKNIFGQANTKDIRSAVCLGVQYTLPMLIIGDARIDSDKKIRLQLSREDVPISKRLRSMFMVNTDKEYMTGFRYIFAKNISVTTHYDSDMGFGIGATFNY